MAPPGLSQQLLLVGDHRNLLATAATGGRSGGRSGGVELSDQVGVAVNAEGAVEMFEDGGLLAGDSHAVPVEILVAGMTLDHGGVPERVLADAVE